MLALGIAPVEIAIGLKIASTAAKPESRELLRLNEDVVEESPTGASQVTRQAGTVVASPRISGGQDRVVIDGHRPPDRVAMIAHHASRGGELGVPGYRGHVAVLLEPGAPRLGSLGIVEVAGEQADLAHQLGLEVTRLAIDAYILYGDPP